MVDIVCDVQQIDETGYTWTFLDESADPDVIVPGMIVVAGDHDEPAFARVIDIVGDGDDRRVHLEILPGAPAGYLAAAHRAHLADAI